MRTVIVGNRKLARQLLRHTLTEGWNVVGALVPEGELAATQANFVPFDRLTEGTDCDLHETSDINADETLQWLQSLSPDLCLCGGWSQIIDKSVLDVPNDGFLGFHSSPLPEGRGGAPVNWALICGADEVWISLFEYVPAVDAGDVLAQGKVSVEPRDDISTIFDALATEACRLVSSVRQDFQSGETAPEPQKIGDATYRPRRQPQDGLIDWRREPDELFDWVRAQTDPYPGAYTFYEGEQLTVWTGERVDKDPDGTVPGEVISVIDGQGVDVRAGDGVFRITRLQAGEKPSTWADRYADAVGISPGDRLGRQWAPDEWLYTGAQRLLEPTPFDTNLTVGESGRIELLALSGSRHEILAAVSVDGERIFERSVTVVGSYREEVSYVFSDPGTHTVSVRFETNGDVLDTRYLKVYVQD